MKTLMKTEMTSRFLRNIELLYLLTETRLSGTLTHMVSNGRILIGVSRGLTFSKH